MRGTFTSFLVALVVVLASCSAFGDGEDNGGAPVTVARSVKCGQSTCTGEDLCCLGGGGETSCATNCPERSYVCDDSADCTDGRVCCIDVAANDRNSAMVGSSTCRPPNDCQTSTAESGPKRFRGCDPLKADCGDKSCVQLTGGVYPTVFPRSQIWVCN